MRASPAPGVIPDTLRRLLAAGLIALLAACGGGDDANSPAAVRQPAAQVPQQVLSVAALFDWAQATYPELFKGGPVSGYSAPYTYRYFPQSDTYVGEAAGAIYVLGAFTNWNVMYVGQLSSFTCSVLPDACRPFFEEVPGAFPDIGNHVEALGGSAIMTNVAALDLDKDGRLDIVAHLWARAGGANVPLGAPTPNRLVALLQVAPGKFEDRTAQVFGAVAVDLCGAATRKHRVADLNGDGYADIVYATNREDGRSAEWSAKSCAVLSKGDGTYRVVEFGQSIFHHSVELATDPAGRTRVLLPGSESGFAFESGQPVFTDMGLPLLGQETILATSSGSLAFTDRILSTNASGQVTTTTLLEYGTTDFISWSKVAEFKFDTARLVKFGNTPADAGDAILYSYRGAEFIGANFFESCSLRVSPGEAPQRIVHFTPYALPAGSGGRSFIAVSELQPYSRLMALKPVDGVLVETGAVAGSLTGENINFIDCGDLDGDGYEDVATYPYRPGAKPIVYLNNREGSLVRVADSVFPEGPAGGQWTSMLVDLDGNGVKDLVYFPGNGCTTGEPGCTRFLLWRGARPLQ